VDSGWIDAIANVFSAVGTVGAFTVAMVLFRREQRREEVRDEEERRDQAVKVSAWIEAVRGTHGGREIVFHVHNASAMPIYEVSLLTPIPGIGDDDRDNDGIEEHDEAEFIGLVPPGQTIRRPAPPEWTRTYYAPEPVPIEFRDSSGQPWTRDDTGALITRTSDEPQPKFRPTTRHFDMRRTGVRRYVR
jgi:hypothetical protein